VTPQFSWDFSLCPPPPPTTSLLLFTLPYNMSRFKTTSSHSNGYETFNAVIENTVAKHYNWGCMRTVTWTHLRLLRKTEAIKVKLKLSLCLNKHHAMKTYWGNGGMAPLILDLGTRWRWVVSFTPRPLYPQGKSPLYPLDRMLGGPRAVLDAVSERKIPSPCRESSQ
jgi:hypothetical protein